MNHLQLLRAGTSIGRRVVDGKRVGLLGKLVKGRCGIGPFRRYTIKIRRWGNGLRGAWVFCLKTRVAWGLLENHTE